MMEHIEKVLNLRDVDLFRFCRSSEIMALASLARAERYPEGTVFFRLGDTAQTLYILLEGKVGLTGGEGQVLSVGKGETFGHMEILSGRLRLSTAVAEESIHALQIDADEFFDLMADNSQIVKALFRKLSEGWLVSGAGESQV